jgi:hypothetical protein
LWLVVNGRINGKTFTYLTQYYRWQAP